MAILLAMTQAVRAEFAYNPRDEMGTQDPLVTLESGSGTCRDFALFLMEAVRSLGFAARFVSGYLYDEDQVGDGERERRRRRRDPRLGADLSAGRGLGRVRSDQRAGRRPQPDPRGGCPRSRSQAIPLSGSFTGASNAYLGMTVEVEIKTEAPQPEE